MFLQILYSPLERHEIVITEYEIELQIYYFTIYIVLYVLILRLLGSCEMKFVFKIVVIYCYNKQQTVCNIIPRRNSFNNKSLLCSE